MILLHPKLIKKGFFCEMYENLDLLILKNISKYHFLIIVLGEIYVKGLDYFFMKVLYKKH